MLNGVVFEPTTIDEFVVNKTPDGEPTLSRRWPRDYAGLQFTYTESLEQCLTPLNLTEENVIPVLVDVMRDVDRDITWRDLLLVYQCDGLIMWRPFWRGNRSSGAIRELQVFSKRESHGKAIMIHQTGDVASWGANTLLDSIKKRGARPLGDLSKAGNVLEDGLVEGYVDWDHLVEVIAQDISVTDTRQILGTGGATQVQKADSQKLSIAKDIVQALKKAPDELFDSVSRLHGQGKLIALKAKNLDIEEAIMGVLRVTLAEAIKERRT